MIERDACRQFANQFGSQNCSNTVKVARRVQFDDIGPYNRRGLFVKRSKHVAQAQAPRFGMRYAGGFRWINAVKVNTDIKRAIKDGHLRRMKVRYWQDFHAIAIRLFTAMAVQRAYADLDKAACMPAFHDPREGRCVAARIAFEIGIKIGVGIEMQDVERPVARRQRGDNGIGHGMVAAEQKRHRSVFNGRDNRLIVSGHIAVAKRQIAAIGKVDVSSQFQPAFAGSIAPVTPQRGTNGLRALSGTAFEGTVDIGREANEMDCNRHGAITDEAHANVNRHKLQKDLQLAR